MSDKELDEFLLQIKDLPLSRDERIQLLKKVLKSGDDVKQEHLDRVMARLLEQIQKEP